MSFVCCSNFFRHSSDTPCPKRQRIEIGGFEHTSHQIQFPTNDCSSVNSESEILDLTCLKDAHFDWSELASLNVPNLLENIPNSGNRPLSPNSSQLAGPTEEYLIPKSIFETEFCSDEFERILNCSEMPLSPNSSQLAGPTEEYLIPKSIFETEFCSDEFDMVLNAFNDDLSELNIPEPEKLVLVTTELPQSDSTEVNSDLQQISSVNIPPVQNQMIISYSENGLPIIKYSHGIFSWSKKDVECKLFIACAQTRKFHSRILYYGTDNYENTLLFKYAANTISLFTKDERISEKEYTSKFMNTISAILSTVISLYFPHNPYYYVFKYKAINPTPMMQEGRKIPVYFLFTTICYLMQTGERNKEIFKPLIEEAYRRITTANLFKSNKWNFLKDFLKETFGIDEMKGQKRDSHNVRFDISIVSFIYNEKKNGANEKTKKFFQQVWEACKEYLYGRIAILLNENPKLIVPHSAECNLIHFEQIARKIYQLEFTDLLFRQWNSIDELIEKYRELKNDFDSIPIDFRLRAFSSNDFELLKNSLEQIKLFPIDSSSIDFFIELEYFITFKCFIFACDFCSNLTENSISFEKTFENIKSIHKSFDEIRRIFSSKEIQLPDMNYNLLEPNTNNSFSLKVLIDNFPFFITIPFGKFIICDELSIFLDKFQYFKCNLSAFKDISRFQCFSFIAELEELLVGNNNDEIERIFSDEKYKVFRELWKMNINIESIISIEERKKFLQHFKNFLTLNNQ